MTAYAGDALSHDYFIWPQKQFFTANFWVDFQADFQAPIRDGSAARFSRPRPAREGASAASSLVPPVFAWAP